MEQTDITLEDGTRIIVLHDRHGDVKQWDGISPERHYTVNGHLLRCPVCDEPSTIPPEGDRAEVFRVEKTAGGVIRSAWVCSEEHSVAWAQAVKAQP